MNTDQLWAKHWPVYQQTARDRGQLPTYRDWRKPLYVSDAPDHILGGVTALFCYEDPLYQGLVAVHNPPPAHQPRAWTAGFYCEDKAVPLFRNIDLGFHEPEQEAPIPACTWEQLTQAHQIKTARGEWRIDDRMLTLPVIDPEDRAAEIVRFTGHTLWQDAGLPGYLGGEFLGVMLSAACGINSTTLSLDPETLGEIHTSDRGTAAVLGENAAALCGRALLQVSPTALGLFLDGIEPPPKRNTQGDPFHHTTVTGVL